MYIRCLCGQQKITASMFWFTHVVHLRILFWLVFSSAANKPGRAYEVSISPAYRPEVPTRNPSCMKYAIRTFHPKNHFSLSWCIFFNLNVVSTRDSNCHFVSAMKSYLESSKRSSGNHERYLRAIKWNHLCVKRRSCSLLCQA